MLGCAGVVQRLCSPPGGGAKALLIGGSPGGGDGPQPGAFYVGSCAPPADGGPQGVAPEPAAFAPALIDPTSPARSSIKIGQREAADSGPAVLDPTSPTRTRPKVTVPQHGVGTPGAASTASTLSTPASSQLQPIEEIEDQYRQAAAQPGRGLAERLQDLRGGTSRRLQITLEEVRGSTGCLHEGFLTDLTDTPGCCSPTSGDAFFAAKGPWMLKFRSDCPDAKLVQVPIPLDGAIITAAGEREFEVQNIHVKTNFYGKEALQSMRGFQRDTFEHVVHKCFAAPTVESRDEWVRMLKEQADKLTNQLARRLQFRDAGESPAQAPPPAVAAQVRESHLSRPSVSSQPMVVPTATATSRLSVGRALTITSRISRLSRTSRTSATSHRRAMTLTSRASGPGRALTEGSAAPGRALTTGTTGSRWTSASMGSRAWTGGSKATVARVNQLAVALFAQYEEDQEANDLQLHEQVYGVRVGSRGAVARPSRPDIPAGAAGP